MGRPRYFPNREQVREMVRLGFSIDGEALARSPLVGGVRLAPALSRTGAAVVHSSARTIALLSNLPSLASRTKCVRHAAAARRRSSDDLCRATSKSCARASSAPCSASWWSRVGCLAFQDELFEFAARPYDKARQSIRERYPPSAEFRPRPAATAGRADGRGWRRSPPCTRAGCWSSGRRQPTVPPEDEA